MKYIMSLGSDCTPALYLRDNKIRNTAFPFDWCVTPMGSVLDMFETDFQYFLKEENLVFLPPANRKKVIEDTNNIDNDDLVSDIITPVYCERYHMLLPHDFSKNGEKDLPAVQEKYKARISRLLELLKDPTNSFIFVAYNRPTAPGGWRDTQYRQASNKTFKNDFNEWQSRLNNILNIKYPNLKYKTYTLDEFVKYRQTKKIK